MRSHTPQVALVLAVLLAAPAMTSAQAIKADGVAYTKDTSVMYQISPGHTLLLSMSEYGSFEPEDPANPFATAKGPCFGEIEYNQSAVGGDGYCVWEDADGDQVTIRWMPSGMDADGDTVGEWSIMQGTGKWSNATGGGQWKYHVDEDTMEGVNRVRGSIRLSD